MKQLIYLQSGKLQWQEAPEPKLQNPQEALVRPIVAARCDLDSSIASHNLEKTLRIGALLHATDPSLKASFGKRPLRGPFAIGHEAIGEVISLGSEVHRLQVGQKVVIPWAISCGACMSCQKKLFSKCHSHPETNISAYGFGKPTGDWGGLISDIVRVPFADHMLTVIPNEVDYKTIASASDNLNDAYRSVGPFLKKQPNSEVLVVGGGAQSIGLYAVTIATTLGASRVDFIDTNRKRLDIAEKLGANPTQVKNNQSFEQQAAPLKEGYPITVDAGNTPERLRFAIAATAPGGDCTTVGMYFQKKINLPLWKMYVQQIHFHVGMTNPPVGIPEILQLTHDERFKPELVTTCLAPWEDAPQAYSEKTVKVVLHREPTHS